MRKSIIKGVLIAFCVAALQFSLGGMSMPRPADIAAQRFDAPPRKLGAGDAWERYYTMDAPRDPPCGHARAMSFDQDFSVMVTPEGQRIPLMHYQNLILIDIELNDEPETATPEPTSPPPDTAPRVTRGLTAGSFLAAALAVAVVNLDAVIEPIRGLRQRECFEAFAGCGSMADAFRADGGVVAGLLERDPAKLPLLRAAHEHAQFHLDYEDASWASFAWSANALRVVLGGPPCQPVAPTGKRLGIGDPRSAALLGFVNIVRRLQPHMAVLENLWALLTEGLFDFIVTLLAAPPLPGEARYILRLPEGQRAEFHQSAHNNSAVHRGRLVGYFEREDVAAALPAPEPLPPARLYRRPHHIGDFLAGSPAEDEYVDGKVIKVKPYHTKPDDDRSPLVTHHLIFEPGSPLRPGSVVNLTRSGGEWVIEEFPDPSSVRVLNTDFRRPVDGIVDANHAREIHSTASGFARSRSGGAIQALGSSICAFSAVQKSTALSTYEAELYALVLISRTLLAQRRLAEFLLDQTLPTSVVGCDNESTLKSLRRRDLTARNRHIRVYLGFILDAIDSNEIRFEHRVSHLNEANTLTKAEDDVTFLRSLIKLAGLPPNYKLQAASRAD